MMLDLIDNWLDEKTLANHLTHLQIYFGQLGR
jgi:hypothetical protein